MSALYASPTQTPLLDWIIRSQPIGQDGGGFSLDDATKVLRLVTRDERADVYSFSFDSETGAGVWYLSGQFWGKLAASGEGPTPPDALEQLVSRAAILCWFNAGRKERGDLV